MPGNMVITVGTNPLPALLTACQHHASQVWLVHSSGDAGTEPQAQRVAQQLREHCAGITVQLVDIGTEAGDFAAVRAGLDNLPPAPWRCDYTGGTTVMSVMLVERHLLAHGTNSADLRSYWDEAANEVRYDSGHAQLCTPNTWFDLATCHALHGFAWDGGLNLHHEFTDDGKRVCEFAYNVLTGVVSPDETGLSAEHAQQLRMLVSPEQNSGRALELTVGALLMWAPRVDSGLPAPDELRVGISASRPGAAHAPSRSKEIELDVVARYGARVLVVSCKNLSTPAGKIAAAAGKLHYETRALYGGAARQVLLAADKCPPASPDESDMRPEFTKLLLGPGLSWRSPHVLNRLALPTLLAEAIGVSGRAIGELRRLLCDDLRLDPVAPHRAVAGQPLSGRLDQGKTLIATLSGNVLAIAAAARGHDVAHVVVPHSAQQRGGISPTQWSKTIRKAVGTSRATVSPVEVAMTSVPAMVSTLSDILDRTAGRGAVVDITGGTKAASVAGFLAARSANEKAARSGEHYIPVRVCYSDIWRGQRRWLDSEAEPLPVLHTDIDRLLQLPGREKTRVIFDPYLSPDTAPAAATGGKREGPTRLLHGVLERLRQQLGCDAHWYQPKLVDNTSKSKAARWLPEHVLLVVRNRVVGVYAYSELTGGKGFGQALFVDAMVAALGGDVARSLFITSQEKTTPESANYLARLDALIRRPFPPRVLWKGDAEQVAIDDGALDDLVTWIYR